MITLATFIIMACLADQPCTPLEVKYGTLPDCRAAIDGLTEMWRQNMDAMLIPAMHCHDESTDT